MGTGAAAEAESAALESLLQARASMGEPCTLPLKLRIRRCTEPDLPLLEWFGLYTCHREIIHEAFRRQEIGETLMLVAEANRFPAGQVWIDLARERASMPLLALSPNLMTGRRMTLLARGYDDVIRRHARFVSWRRTWAHIIEARACRQADPLELPSAVWSPGWVLQRLDPERSNGVCGDAPQRRLLLRLVRLEPGHIVHLGPGGRRGRAEGAGGQAGNGAGGDQSPHRRRSRRHGRAPAHSPTTWPVLSPICSTSTPSLCASVSHTFAIGVPGLATRC